MKLLRLSLPLLGLLLALTAVSGMAQRIVPQSALGSGFTYQGRLTDGGSAANGLYDFTFALYDDPAAGSQVGSTLTREDVSVSDGLFTVALDFGSVFDGTALYLQIAVRPGNETGGYTTLTPRQPLTAAPYAHYALRAPWSGLSGVPAGFADGLDDDTTYSAGTGLILSGSQFSLDTASTDARYWKLDGNSGIDPATQFLGTTDAQPLALRTNNIERARLDEAGNLGLGVTNPDARLTVRGNARLLGEDAPAPRGTSSANLQNPFSVYVSGRYAYVASYDNRRLAVFDVSNPDNIILKGYTDTNLNYPRSVYVSGRYAYVISEGNSRLAVFDISDPTDITAKGYTSANLNAPRSVYVSGRYAYVASGGNDRLAVFDVSDPDRITAKGFTDTNLDRPISVYVSGRYAYVASYDNNRLAVFDVSDPNNIIPKGFTSANLQTPFSVYVSGHYAYVASFSNHRLAVFDVSNPDSITAISSTNTNLNSPTSVYVSGRYAYVASYNNHRLAVFDVSDPGNIIPKGYTSTNLQNPFSVYVSGHYAYVASGGNSRLAVFEVNHLESPALETGSLQSGSLAVSDNAIVGNNLHVQGGLNVGAGGALFGGDVSVQGSLFARASVTTVTGSAALTVSQAGVVLVNNAANATITLPAAASAKGLTFTIKRLTASAVTVNSAGGSIDGSATQALAAQYNFITVISDGANWFIISR